MTKERFGKAKKLKLIITAGIGSDHTDLQAAMDKGITVAEVTFSNSISVAEHVVMMILALVRNYIPSYGWVVKGGWNIADSVERSYDLEGMNVGTVAAGRIGLAVMRRLKPFGVKLHYTDKHRLPKEVEEELGATYHSTVESLVADLRHHRRAASRARRVCHSLQRDLARRPARLSYSSPSASRSMPASSEPSGRSKVGRLNKPSRLSQNRAAVHNLFGIIVMR